MNTLTLLPKEKAEEVANFANFVLKRYEEDVLQHSINTLTEKSVAFQFLNDEEDIYSTNDIIEKY